MSIEDKQICCACRFWETLKNDDSLGHCHRFPPQIKGPEDDGRYPLVFDAEWCGEFKMMAELDADVK